jgi:hypothetical protein
MANGLAGLLALVALVVLAASTPTRSSADAAGAPAGSGAGAPVELTAEQDLARTMALLGIASLRPGADGFNTHAPNYANYDESKANPYPTLPDPLVLNDGKPVTSAKIWWKQRRPELVATFDDDLYGRVPARTPSVKWLVVKTTNDMAGSAPMITKHLIGIVDNSSCPAISVMIRMNLSTPANAKGPVPVMMQFGFPDGPPAWFRLPPGFKVPTPTWQEQVADKGWGYAIIDPNSVQADSGAGLTQGIIGLCNQGQPRSVGDWGALRAWAWGAGRALDYFETDPAVDAKHVGIEGHSRYGKAALITLAYDQRFAIAYVSSSGEAGAKLWRRNWGEQEGNIAASGEYHWMCGNFLKYDGPLTINDLPVDSHELIALCAPRPVFISAGVLEKGDGWVDAKGMFMAAAAAGPVYKLLGKKDMGTTVFPPPLTALIDGDIGYCQHDQGHTDYPNWATFLKFAGRYFPKPASDNGARMDDGLKQ